MLLNKKWIPVKTSEGMFSSEYSVSLKLNNGNFVSFFADNSLIKQEGNDYFLNVTLVNDYPQSRTQLVLLPTETFETSSRWAEIPSI